MRVIEWALTVFAAVTVRVSTALFAASMWAEATAASMEYDREVRRG